MPTSTKTRSLRDKISIISHGINYDYEMFADTHLKYYENTYGYCITNEGVERRHRIPQVLNLPDDLVVSVLRRDNSPWTLQFENDALRLFYNGEYRYDIGLPDPLPFFGKVLSDGTRTEDLISAYGAKTPGFFFYPDCYYFTESKACTFCSLREARKTVARPLEKKFTRQRMLEATTFIMNSGWDIPMITNTCGTPTSDEVTRKLIIEPLKAINERKGEKTKMHLLAHPPNDFKIFYEFKEAGVTSIALNLEIYDRKSFKEICPGKDQLYGYDKWWDSLEFAKDVFGAYEVYCGLIWGLEPIASSKEGMEEILSRQIGLATNVFHSDPGTPLASHPQPTEAEIFELAAYEDGLYKKYQDAKTIYDISMRNTIDWEIHNGYVDETPPLSEP